MRVQAKFALLLALTLIYPFFLPPMVYADVEKASASDADYLQLSETLTQNIAQGDYQSIQAYLSEETKTALSPIALTAAFFQLRPLVGSYEKMLGSMPLDGSNANPVIMAFARHSENDLCARFVWQDGEIYGLWLSPATAADLAVFRDYLSDCPYSTGEGCLDEEIAIGPWELPGLITRPQDARQEVKIVAILVQGSGQADKDESIGKALNAPLRDLAAGLAREGIVSVRWPDRYFQHPERVQDYTIEEEVIDDAVAALKHMRADERFKDYHYFIVGHSLGGMVAPIIARDTDADGWVSLAGTPRSLWQVMLDQQIAALSDTPAFLRKSIIQSYEEMAKQAEALNNPAGEGVYGLPASYIVSLNRLKHADVA